MLIRPPYVIPMRSVYGHRGIPPVGLTYLSATLKGQGHETLCIDAFGEDMDSFTPIDGTGLLANGLTIEKLLARIPADVQLIGISCMFSNEWINTSRVIRSVKSAFPEVPLVVGGEHVTADHEHILRNYPEVKACVLGEGEAKIASLVQAFAAGETELSKIPGITWLDRARDKVLTNSFPYRIENIDSIPPPDWSTIPVRRFMERGMGMSDQGKRSIPMLLSRGCPYRCTFCSNDQMWTTKWVARDIDLVIGEIKDHIRDFRIDHIDFVDLTAVVNREWTLAFCERMTREKLGVTWSLPSGTRSEALDRDVLEALHRSGCTKITYAPETGSKVMSARIKKNVKLDRMLRSMRHAVRSGLIVKANIIFGFPDERYRDILANFVFMFKMALRGVHDVPCFGFTPYPGSALFDRLLAEGKIKRDESYYRFLAHLVYSSPLERRSYSAKLPDFALPMLSLGGIAYFYFWMFLFRPWRFARFVSNVLRRRPQTMLEIVFYNMTDDFLLGRRFSRT
ncbi:MAG TPA: cobalamin-dependent protein [Bdellovibrionota bacterium]|nr:cobalamin-dependent protein [Bdellovibrionota bacterium]